MSARRNLPEVYARMTPDGYRLGVFVGVDKGDGSEPMFPMGAGTGHAFQTGIRFTLPAGVGLQVTLVRHLVEDGLLLAGWWLDHEGQLFVRLHNLAGGMIYFRFGHDYLEVRPVQLAAVTMALADD